MGRGQKWDEAWDSSSYPSPTPYKLWHGAWKQKGDGKYRAPKAAAFPAYDANRKGGGGKQGWSERTPDAGDASWEPDSFTSVLQTSLNGTRKSEQRVHSLTNALSRREELWKIYERDIKNAYMKEHARFKRDMSRIREDLQKAYAAQEGARAELRRVFSNGAQVQEDPDGHLAAHMFAAWKSETEEADASAILRRAMGAPAGSAAGFGDFQNHGGAGADGAFNAPLGHGDGAHGPPPGAMASHAGPPPGLMRRPMQAAPHEDVFMADVSGGTGHGTGHIPGHPQELIHPGTLPTMRGPLATDMGPRSAAPPTSGPGFSSNPEAYHGTAVRDPYLPSPGQAALRTRHPSVSPSARVNPYPERRSTEGEPVGMDAAGSLADSLAANRAANPFHASTGEHMGFIRSVDPAGHPVPTFIEDDDELAVPLDPGGSEATTSA